jgi:RNA polymerase sigma-70 factor (ECF subfamily)
MESEFDTHYSEEERTRIFEEEMLPHLDSVYNFAFRVTYDEEIAKDLVQESYYRAYKFLDSFQRGTNAKAWLFRILKNNFINDFRKRNREPSMVDYQEVESYYNSDKAKSPASGKLKQEPFRHAIGDEVTNAINSLDIDFRMVIILCDLEGFTYEEMAKILDIPIGTVRSRLHRARNILKGKLMQYAKSLGYKKKKKDE